MACQSCGQSLSNTALKGAQITQGAVAPQNNGVRIINSAPMPMTKVAASATRKTV